MLIKEKSQQQVVPVSVEANTEMEKEWKRFRVCGLSNHICDITI
jgi:hypothetical protein